MTRRATLLLQSAVCSAALGGAFLAGRYMTPDSTAVVNGRDSGRTLAELSASSPLGSKSGAGATDKLVGGPGAGLMKFATPEQAAVKLTEIFKNPDPVSRMADYLAFLKSLDGNEAHTAALGALLENFNPRERGRELQMLMTQWGGKDPEAALASVKERKDWIGGWAANTVLGNWAQKNPDQAIAWATENGKEGAATDEGNAYMAGVLGGLAKTDLDRASTLAESMDRSRARGEVMDKVLDQFFAQRTPDAAREWVAGLQDSPFKNGILGKLAGRLADKDVTSAATWAGTLPDSEAKPYVMAQVVERWSKDNPNEAGAWLNQFPPSVSTDQPRETFAWQVQKDDPEAAIAWASTITDEGRRGKATRELVKNWFQREPENAMQYINSSNLPDEVKQRYAQRAAKGHG